MDVVYIDHREDRRSRVKAKIDHLFQDGKRRGFCWVRECLPDLVAARSGLVVVHINNDDLAQKVTAQSVGLGEETVFEWLWRRVFAGGNRLILFSGGKIEQDAERLLASCSASQRDGVDYVVSAWCDPETAIDWDNVHRGSQTLRGLVLNAGGASQCLAALAVLCQGFLAVHGASGPEATGNVKAALDTMGWTDFCEQRRLQEGEKFEEYRRTLSSKVEDIDKKYWLDPFIAEAVAGVAEPVSLADLVQKEWKNEKGADTDVVSLIRQIETNGTVDADQVAKAYSALVDQLK